jgi:ribosome-binding protein aMBF1 (putative translation factor)
MRTLQETPDLRWFDPYPPCRMCGKKADGNLMSVRNERYGEHCKRCADKRLKLSKEVREMLAKEQSA